MRGSRALGRLTRWAVILVAGWAIREVLFARNVRRYELVGAATAGIG